MKQDMAVGTGSTKIRRRAVDDIQPPAAEGRWWYKDMIEPAYGVWVKAVPRKEANKLKNGEASFRMRQRLWTKLVVVLADERLAKRYFHVDWNSREQRFNHSPEVHRLQEQWEEIYEAVFVRLAEGAPEHPVRSKEVDEVKRKQRLEDYNSRKEAGLPLGKARRSGDDW